MVDQDGADQRSGFSLDLVIKFDADFIVSVFFFVLRNIKYDFPFSNPRQREVPRRAEHGAALTTTARQLIQKQRPASVTYQLVLIGCDSGEDGLHKHEGTELLRLEVEQRGRVVLLLDDVDPRLVLVHGVQDYLENHKFSSVNVPLSPTSEKPQSDSQICSTQRLEIHYQWKSLDLYFKRISGKIFFYMIPYN